MPVPSTSRLAVALTALLSACGARSSRGTTAAGSVGFGSGAPTADIVAADSLSADSLSADSLGADSLGADSASDSSGGPQSGGTGDGAAMDAAGAAGATDGGASDVPGEVEDAGALVGCPGECTADQVCQAGKCVQLPKACGGSCPIGQYCDPGTDSCLLSHCTLPSAWGPTIQKMSYFAVATSSQGCDLDGDATPDNVLGNILKLYPAVNQELDKSIQDGLFVMLLEAPDFAADGSKFAIHGLLGEVDPSNSGCSMTSPWANCSFTIDNDNYGGGPAGTTCPPQVVLSPATVATGGVLSAGGGKGQTITVKLPTAIPLKVRLSQVTMSGYLQGGAVWDRTNKGKLCGVITKKDFQNTIDAVPDSAWQQLSLTKEQATLIIKATLQPDIDTKGDGFPDAISVAFLFETVKAQISKLVY